MHSRRARGDIGPEPQLGRGETLLTAGVPAPHGSTEQEKRDIAGIKNTGGDMGAGTGCIDLRTLGDYKITIDESSESRDDPWMRQIPCAGRGVVVYPHGGTRLAVTCDHRPSIAKRLGLIEGVTLAQDGDDEKTFVFDVSLWPLVAEVVKPRVRRAQSEEQRAASVERLKKYQYPSARHESSDGARDRVEGSDDPGVDSEGLPGCDAA